MHSGPDSLPSSLRIDTGRRIVSLDPRDPVFVQDPYPAYAEILERVPVFRWEQMGHWCFAGHEAVSALLRDRRFGRQVLHVASRADLGWPEPPAHLEPFLAFERHSLLELEPPAHTRLRTLVNRPFLTRIGEGLRPALRRIADDCLAGVDEGEPWDLIERFAEPVPVRAITHVLGVPETIGPRMLAWSHDMVAMYQARRDEQVERAAARASGEFSACIRELAGEKRRRPDDGLVSELLRAEAGGERLSEDELVTTVMLFLIAGHEATVHAIGNGVKAVLEHGAAGAAADAVGCAALAEESLRFDPPLHLFTRFALEDAEVHGVRLAKGGVIGLLLGAANRDPSRFSEPSRLDPARSPNPHVAFGGGLHFCLGAPLARLELQEAYAALFARFPALRLAGEVRYRDTYHFRGLERLVVRG